LRLEKLALKWTSMPSSTVTGNKRTKNTRLIMRNRSVFFVRLYSIINKNIFFFLELHFFVQ
jgi:hypothetical protein